MIDNQNFYFYLEQYPNDELYRLFIDARLIRNEKGWMAYESREPGCIKALFKAADIAFFKEIENLDLSEGLIKDIHRACTTSVKNLNSSKLIPGQYRVNATGFNFYAPPSNECINNIYDMIDRHHKNINAIGREKCRDAEVEVTREWLNQACCTEEISVANKRIRIISEDIEAFEWGGCGQVWSYNKELLVSVNTLDDTYKNNNCTKGIIASLRAKYKTFGAPAASLIPNEVSRLIKEYNSAIHSSTITEDEKISLIASTAWEFLHLHPYRDANLRTFGIILLNRLLLQNHLGLATFDDPNCLGHFGKNEFANEIKKAIKNTEIILQQKSGNLLGFNSQDISSNHKEKMNEWSRSFIDKIKPQGDVKQCVSNNNQFFIFTTSPIQEKMTTTIIEEDLTLEYQADDDPNCLGHFGKNEFANEIKKAIKNTEIILQQKSGNLLGFNSQDISSNHKEKMNEWRRLFIDTIKPQGDVKQSVSNNNQFSIFNKSPIQEKMTTRIIGEDLTVDYQVEEERISKIFEMD